MKNLKKIFAGFTALSIAGSFAACSSEGDPAETTTAEITTTPAVTVEIKSETLSSEAQEQIGNAMALVVMMVLLSLGGGLFLVGVEGVSFLNGWYESASAIATVGLSAGLTPSLGLASRLLLIVYMYFGRVGLMTISLGFLAGDRAKERFHYAETKLLIG